MKRLLPFILFSLFCFSSWAATQTVNVVNSTFSPANFTINMGDTVKFVWVNGTHTTTSTLVPAGATTWDKPMDAGNTSFIYVPNKPGAYEYQCSFHFSFGMTGKFTVACPTVSINPLQSTVCAGNCKNLATSLSGGSTLAGTYNWSPGTSLNTTSGKNVIACPTVATTYTVHFSSSTGCTATSTAFVGVTNVTIGETHKNETCGNANGSINLNVLPAGTYTYHWTNGATTKDITGLTAGNYGITVVSSGGCFVSSIIAINNTNGPTLSNNHVNSVCGFNNGSINLTVNGGLAPYKYKWSNTATTQDISNLGAGTYTVTVTDANFCTAFMSVSITTTNGPITNETHVNPTCGFNNGSINISVTGGVPPYTYTWSNGKTTEDISGLSAGTYGITVSDVNGCGHVRNIQLALSNGPALTFTKTNVTCNGGQDGSINLTVTGGTAPYKYDWSNAATTKDISGLAAGSYVVTVRDNNSCSAKTTVNITQPTVVKATNVITQPDCNNPTGGIDITVSGGTSPYFYLWSTSATTEDITNMLPGTYNVVISDNKGCSIAKQYVLQKPKCPLPTATKASNITFSSATISWQLVGCVVTYRIEIREVGTTTWSYYVVTGANSKTITTLKPSTQYEFHVRSNCSFGSSAYTTTQKFTTPSAGTCVPPGSLSSSNLTNVSARVNWAAVLTESGYKLQYRAQGAGTWKTINILNNAVVFRTLNGLTANTTYEWQIATRCDSAGTVFSLFSPIQKFKTTLRLEDVSLTESKLVIYPNPTGNRLYISIGAVPGDVLTVNDLTGRTVITQSVNQELSQLSVDVSSLSAGSYFVSLRTKDGIAVQKFIKE